MATPHEPAAAAPARAAAPPRVPPQETVKQETVKLDLDRPAGPELLIGPQPKPSEAELATMPTVLVPRPRADGAVTDEASPHAPLAVAALVNTAWATLLSLAPVLLLVVLARVTLGQTADRHTVTVALAGWLLAHGVPLTTPIGELGLAPLTVTLLVVWRLNRAGVHVTRGIGARGSRSPRAALLAAAGIGVVYGGFGVLAAVLARQSAVDVVVWRSGVQLALIGTLAGLLGSIRATGALRQLARATPQVVRDGIRTGVVAGLLLLGLGAGVAGLSIAINGSEAAAHIAAYQTGLSGQAGVTLVSLAYAPVFAAWATAYLLGPGFAIGTDAMVGAGGVTVGALPVVPVIAGIPDQPLAGALWLIMATPMAMSMAASLLLVWRRLRLRHSRAGDVIKPVPHWGRMAGSALLAGPVAGVLLGGVALLAAGSVGGGRLAMVGPVAWQMALGGTLVVAIGALAGIGGAYLRQRLAGQG